MTDTPLSDDVVETCARAVAADQEKRRYGPGWGKLTRYGKAHLRRDTRAALEAARYGEMVEALRDFADHKPGAYERARALLSSTGASKP